MHVIESGLLSVCAVLEQWIIAIRGQYCGTTGFGSVALVHALLLVVECNDLYSGLYRFVTLLFLLDSLKISRLSHHLPLLFSQLIRLIAFIFKEFNEGLLGRSRAVIVRLENQVLIVRKNFGIVHWIELFFLLLSIFIFHVLWLGIGNQLTQILLILQGLIPQFSAIFQSFLLFGLFSFLPCIEILNFREKFLLQFG